MSITADILKDLLKEVLEEVRGPKIEGPSLPTDEQLTSQLCSELIGFLGHRYTPRGQFPKYESIIGVLKEIAIKNI